jgi:DNA-binding transcriptional regulator LsrR (DeoR family)
VVLTEKGKQEQLTREKIDGLTMGQLTGRFGRIVQQTHADRVIGDALKRVNPNRIGVAHHKRRAADEAKLRRDVGRQMWLIIGALKEIDRAP